LHELRIERRRRIDDGEEAVLVGEQVMQREVAFTLRCTAFADGEQRGQVGVADAAGGKDEDVGREPVGETQSTSDRKGQAEPLRCDVGSHDPGERVAIGDRRRGMVECGRAFDELLGVAPPGEEREVRRDCKLGVLHARAAADGATGSITGIRTAALFTVGAVARVRGGSAVSRMGVQLGEHDLRHRSTSDHAHQPCSRHRPSPASR
jgi:hypothetical protein